MNQFLIEYQRVIGSLLSAACFIAACETYDFGQRGGSRILSPVLCSMICGIELALSFITFASMIS